ncbi:MAG: hypothetical protein IIZ38_02220 [Sphingomonas sp.]|uniref:hypothetical protein n=1 Tax=Sphingomonas sp. TaxID=28214 RepID=UPI0025E2BB24|nr:hypothetical protein [Sphingomonas sp.]MBQ1497106.1 hypothetical protein [Sphingomonas sp.]
MNDNDREDPPFDLAQITETRDGSAPGSPAGRRSPMELVAASGRTRVMRHQDSDQQ